MFRISTILLLIFSIFLVSTTSALAQVESAGKLIFADGFETGNFIVWSKFVPDKGDLSVSSSAALLGSQGMKVLIDDDKKIYVQDNSPKNEVSYRAKFLFDPNSIKMANGNSFAIFSAQDKRSVYKNGLRVQLSYSNKSYYLRAGTRKDSLKWLSTDWIKITDKAHLVEVEWKASESHAKKNGQLKFYIGNVLKASLSGINNDTWLIDRARLGAVAGIDSGTLGQYYLDAFASYR